MLGRFRQKTWSQRLLSGLLALVLVSSLASCGNRASGGKNFGIIRTSLAEVAPPEIISELRQTSSKYQPRVKIVSPKADQVLDDTDVSFKFQVDGLPIFKDPDLELGSHLHVTIDNVPYQDVYDLTEPLIVEKLAPGTHTIRVLANTAWHESFKNEGAYAQQTFHILTKSNDNILDEKQALITYNSPQGDYSALPLLLDFYLNNPKKADPIAKVKVTVNGEEFTLDNPEPIYLEGFKKGKNWIKLEALDKDNKVITNIYKDTLGVVNYQSDAESPLSKLLESKLSASEALKIVDPKYKPEPVEVIETPEVPVIEPSPSLTPVEVEPLPEKIQPAVPIIPPLPIPSETPKFETLPEKIIKDAEKISTPATELEATPEPQASPKSSLLDRFRRQKPTPAPAIETPASISPVVVPSLPSPEVTPQASPTPSLLQRFRPSGDKPGITPPVAIETPSPEPKLLTTPDAVLESPETEVTSPPSFMERLRNRSTAKPETTPAPTPVVVPSPEVETTPAPSLIERLKNRSISTDAKTAPTPTPIKTPDAVLESPETEVTSPPSFMERLRSRSTAEPEATSTPEVIPSPEVETTPAPSLIERLKNRSTDVESVPAPTAIKTPDAVLEPSEVKATPAPSFLERLQKRSTAKPDATVPTPEVLPSPEIGSTPVPNLIDRLKNRSDKDSEATSKVIAEPSASPRNVKPTPEVPIIKPSPEAILPEAIENQTSVKTEPQDKSSEFLQRLLPKDTNLRIETEEGTTEVRAEKLPMIQASPQAGIPSRYLRRSESEQVESD